jgi:4-amino-4-deoxy-L-arabinose transferase-like glycosyltransferase
MDPLYPYWLAVVYWVFGRDLLVVRVLQIAMSVVTCGLVARLGWIVGGRWVAVGAPAVIGHEGGGSCRAP